MSTAPVAGGCNTAIGGQGQLGCMRPVCSRSSSELQISAHTTLKDAATLSWLGLVKQVLPIEGRVVGWLVPMVQSRVRAQARAKWHYRLLSCPGSAAGTAAGTAAAAAAAEQQQQQCSNSCIKNQLTTV